MTSGMTSKPLTALAGVAALVLLAGCVGASVHVVDPTLALSVCPAEQETRYTVVTMSKAGARREFKAKVNVADGEKAPVYRAPGRLYYPEHAVTKDLSWIRFTVYCGDSTKSALVTPRIAPKDLYKREIGRDFYYLVE